MNYPDLAPGSWLDDTFSNAPLADSREHLRLFLDLSPRSYIRAVVSGDIVDEEILDAFAIAEYPLVPVVSAPPGQ